MWRRRWVVSWPLTECVLECRPENALDCSVLTELAKQLPSRCWLETCSHPVEMPLLMDTGLFVSSINHSIRWYNRVYANLVSYPQDTEQSSKQLVDKVDIVDVTVMSTTVRTADSARDLGVILDSYLTIARHVSAMCWVAYYQLRQLRPLMRSLSDAAKLLVQAFISTRLDYCNSLMYGISDSLNRRLHPHHQHEKMRAHHAGPAAAALADGPTACAFQARRASVQVTTRPAAILPGGGLPTRCCHRTLPTAFVGHRHVSSSANQHTVRWSLVCSCRATDMEQSANPIARLRTLTRTIQAVTEDTSLQTYILLLTAAVPSDSVFHALGTNWLTYLLTYFD